MYLYSVLRDPKYSFNWSAGAFGTLLQCFTYLWLQQRNLWSQPYKNLWLPILVNERNIELTVIIKANQFTSFKYGDIQLLDIMNFLRGATILDSFLKAYKTSETKIMFPYKCFEQPDKMQNTELPPYDVFYSKLRSCNPLQTQYTDYLNLLKSGLTAEEAVIKLELAKSALTGIEKYHNYNRHGSRNKWPSSKTFCGAIT